MDAASVCIACSAEPLRRRYPSIRTGLGLNIFDAADRLSFISTVLRGFFVSE